MKFNIYENIHGVIIGSILGDGSIDLINNALRLNHTKPQKKYLDFKLDLFEQAGYKITKYRPYNANTTFGVYESHQARVKIPDSYWFNKPIEDLIMNLNPLGLLIWWLDDGCLVIHHSNSPNNPKSISRFGYLNTQNCDYETHLKIQYLLKLRFDLDVGIHKDTKSGNISKSDYFRIYINAINLRKMIDLVREFIYWLPKDMLYKLDMRYVINNNPESPMLVKHYNFI